MVSFNNIEPKCFFYTITGQPQDQLSTELMAESASTFAALRRTSHVLKQRVDACWNKYMHYLIYMNLDSGESFTPPLVFNWLDGSRKPPFVIFLDIDGVLTKQTYASINDLPITLQENYEHTAYFDLHAVTHFEEIIHTARKTYEVWIVISSDWRLGFDAEELKYMFSKYYFSYFIIDKTMDTTTLCRGAEIQQWLNNYPKINFLILDDNDGERFQLSHHFPDAFIKVDPDELITKNLKSSIHQKHFNFSTSQSENTPLLPSQTLEDEQHCLCDCTIL